MTDDSGLDDVARRFEDERDRVRPTVAGVEADGCDRPVDDRSRR